MDGVIDIYNYYLNQVITIIVVSVNIKTGECECDGLSIGWLQYPSLKIKLESYHLKLKMTSCQGEYREAHLGSGP